MGLADMFIKLGVRYGSDKSLDIIDKLGSIMINGALQQSALLAKDQGSYPKYNEEAIFKSPFFQENATEETKELVKKYGLRNSQLLTSAPTGSISTMLGVSGGIEPIFDISYMRKTETLHEEETEYEVFTPIVKKYMNSKNIIDKDKLPEYFITAHDLEPIERIEVQSRWQQYIDASISSTINLDNNATVDDIKNIYMLGYDKGLKGLTIYRDGCKRSGILSNNQDNEIKKEMEEVDWIETGICPDCKNNLDRTEGCKSCRHCGWSACSV